MAGQAGNAEVISITGQADPYKAASKDIAAGRAALGMTRAEYGPHLGKIVDYSIDESQVEFWEDGGEPPGAVLKIAQWDAGLSPIPADGGVKVYAGRGEIDRGRWRSIITGVRGHLWLYGMAEQGYANDDKVGGLLSAAVSAGASVRVLLLDPDCPAAAAIDADESTPPGTLAFRIRGALAKFEAMRRDCPEIEIRLYESHPTLSIVRGDDSMLVTTYIRYAQGGNSPTLDVTADSTPGAFENWELHFHSMWNNSRGTG